MSEAPYPDGPQEPVPDRQEHSRSACARSSAGAIPVAAQTGQAECIRLWPAATLSVHGAVTRETTAATDAGPAVRATKRLITGSDHELRGRHAAARAIARVSPGSKVHGQGSRDAYRTHGYDRPAWLAGRATIRPAGIGGPLTFEPVPGGTRMRWPCTCAPRVPPSCGASDQLDGQTPGADCTGSHETVPGGTTAEAVTATLAPSGAGFPRQPARRASSWPRSRRLACCCCRAAPDVLGEEGQDPLPGVRGGGGVVVAPLVVEEGVPGSRVDLQVVGIPAAVRPASSTPAALVVKSLPGHDPTTGHRRRIASLGLGAAP